MPRGRRNPPDLQSDFAAELTLLFRRLLRTTTLTNKALAEKAGLSPSYVGELLNGRKIPSPSTAARSATAMGATPAEVVAARRLAEQPHVRSRPGHTRKPHPAADLWDICVAFALALDQAHHGLRECYRETGPGLTAAADLAVHASGLYAHRERLLIAASPTLASAGETVFIALIDIREAVKRGSGRDTAAYRVVYRPFAKAMWEFRHAVRAEFGRAALSANMVRHANRTDRDRSTAADPGPA